MSWLITIIQYDQIVYNAKHHIQDHAIEQLQEEFRRLDISDRGFDNVTVTPRLPEEYGFILRNHGYDNYVTPENLPLLREICQKIQLAGDLPRPILLKNPWCFPHFLYIKEQFPNAKFIFIHR
ncbi:MAG: sulfotransferase, partial [Acaryochloridaceae cyanobacterium RL_2_7]|nr:sulfotransferase [Acaryochloridaceae cyanobacterium RL_2_7]